MSLVEHAKSELARTGNDPEFQACLIKAVEAFAEYGHSGGSASVAIPILVDLLQFRNLTPLTNDPNEWMKIDEEVTEGLWQSCRNAEAFSKDGGKTYRLQSQGNDGPLHEAVAQ